MAYFEDFLHFLPILFGTLLAGEGEIQQDKQKNKRIIWHL